MCGRYAVTLSPELLRRVFAYGEQPNFPPRYNIAPTQPVATVIRRDGLRHFLLMRWGFIPGFVKDEKRFPLIFNIRAETVREKPSFRAAFQRRRCLIPADAFYEWERRGKERLPWLFRRPDGGPFAFAGLHETWSSPDGAEIDTAAILTTSANGMVAAIHERMPVILEASDHARWLDPSLTGDEAAELLRPAPDEALTMRRVGKAVNAVAHDGPALWESPEGEGAPAN